MFAFIRAQVAGLPPVFWYLWLGQLINRAGSFIAPFLALYLTDVHRFSKSQAGLLLTAFGVGSVMSGLFGGTACDRLGRKPVLLLGLLGSSLLMVVLSVADELAVLAIGTVLLGFFGDIYRPAVSASIADVVAPSDRARAFGLLYWAVNLGFSIAPVVAGLMATRSYRTLFLGDALTTFLFAMLVLVKVPETRPARAVSALHLRSFSAPFSDRRFLRFLALGFGMALVFVQATSSLPLTMRDAGITPREYGMLIAANGVLIVLFQPFATSVLGTRNRVGVLVVSALFYAVGFGLHGAVHSALGFLICIMIWTAGEIIQAPVIMTIPAELAPVALRGSYQGAFHLSFAAANALGPALGGIVLETGGPPVLWGACFGFGIVLAIGYATSLELGARPSTTVETL